MNKIEIVKTEAYKPSEVEILLGGADLKSDNPIDNVEHYVAYEISDDNRILKIAKGLTAQEALANLEK